MNSTSQLGLSVLGLLQLGFIESGSGPTPPPVVIPSMATWYQPTNQPILFQLEVVSY